MRKIVTTVGVISALLITTNSSLFADADENFIIKQGAVNKSFVRSIARNRANKGKEDVAKYLEIDSTEDFEKAIDSGQFENQVETSKIEKQYIYRNIKNADIDENDLKNIEGDTLNLGSTTDGGNVMQSLNIENSKIETDKHITAGVTSTSSDASDITSITNIDNSELSGKSLDKDKGINSTSKYFD